MGYPQRLLGTGEQVVLDLHPHWKRLLVPVVLVPVVVGLASYLVFLVPAHTLHGAVRWLVVAIALVVLLRWSLWPWLRWRTTLYVLTTKRVVIRTGVFGRSGRDVPLTRVNDVSFHHSLLERMLGCGTLTIESAGEHGQVVLPEVPEVERVQREVYRCVEEEARTGAGGPAPED